MEAGVAARRQSGSAVDEQHDTADAQNPKTSYKEIHFVLNIPRCDRIPIHAQRVKRKPIPTTQLKYSTTALSRCCRSMWIL